MTSLRKKLQLTNYENMAFSNIVRGKKPCTEVRAKYEQGRNVNKIKLRRGIKEQDSIKNSPGKRKLETSKTW